MMRMSTRQKLLNHFVNNVGRVVTNTELRKVAGNVSDWRRPISDLRHVDGYTIHSHHDKRSLKRGEYLMPTMKRRFEIARKRMKPTKTVEEIVRQREKNMCSVCGTRENEVNPDTGRVPFLQFDHITPHDSEHKSNPRDPDAWQLLCPLHNGEKKSFWDDKGGRPNVVHMVKHLTTWKEKEKIYIFMQEWAKAHAVDGNVSEPSVKIN